MQVHVREINDHIMNMLGMNILKYPSVSSDLCSKNGILFKSLLLFLELTMIVES